jgi:hypothetical protein
MTARDGGNAKRLLGTIFAIHVGKAEDGPKDKQDGKVIYCELSNSTLSDYIIPFFKDRHSGRACPGMILAGGIAGIQAPGMSLNLPSMALDARFPASCRII